MAEVQCEKFPFIKHILIDSGDSVECVAYRKLLQSGWEPLNLLKKLKLADGSYTTCYGEIPLTCKLKDSEGTKKILTR